MSCNAYLQTYTEVRCTEPLDCSESYCDGATHMLLHRVECDNTHPMHVKISNPLHTGEDACWQDQTYGAKPHFDVKKTPLGGFVLCEDGYVYRTGSYPDHLWACNRPHRKLHVGEVIPS